MSFHVGKPPRDEPSRRPPPDYFSRRVQLRLLTLAAMLMMVLWLMDQARRPENWYWMWGGQPPHAGEAPLTKEELAGRDRKVDTRAPAAPRSPSAPDVFVAQGENGALLEDAEALFDAPPQAADDARLDRTRVDGWSRVLSRIGSDEEERLRKVLKAARDDRRLDEETLHHWPAVRDLLAAAWEQYFQEAFEYLVQARDRLSDEQRAGWQAAVQELELQWRQETLPALDAAGAGAPLSSEERAALHALQATLDRVALAAVRDNAVFRSAERHAWFRLLERLDRSALAEVERASTGRVGFLQLFDQPQEYRGKLVTVRGTARLAYRVQAPENLYGIDHYYVFWVAPAGGPNAPLCVYALETPPGFPPIKDKNEDRATTPLELDLEFTGYFFKRWAYRAQDGMRLAPLVLAKAPRWTPPAAPGSPSRPARPWTVALYILGAAAAAVTITLLAYGQGRWRSAKRRGYEASPEGVHQRLKSLEENDPAQDVREALRRLSEKGSA